MFGWAESAIGRWGRRIVRSPFGNTRKRGGRALWFEVLESRTLLAGVSSTLSPLELLTPAERAAVAFHTNLITLPTETLATVNAARSTLTVSQAAPPVLSPVAVDAVLGGGDPLRDKYLTGGPLLGGYLTGGGTVVHEQPVRSTVQFYKVQRPIVPPEEPATPPLDRLADSRIEEEDHPETAEPGGPFGDQSDATCTPPLLRRWEMAAGY